jgi:hypothetical protein
MVFRYPLFPIEKLISSATSGGVYSAYEIRTKLDFISAYHPQNEGKREVVNRSFRDLFRCLVGDHCCANYNYSQVHESFCNIVLCKCEVDPTGN